VTLSSLRRSPSAAVVNSGTIQKLMAESHGDVLLLNDCWGISPAALSQIPGRRNVYEVLAAGGLETASPEPASGAFTRAIADELTAACKLGSIKVADLFERLTSRMKVAKPRGRGRPPKEPQAKALDEQPSPAHFWLSDTKRSIVLTPLSTRDEGQGTTDPTSTSMHDSFPSPYPTHKPFPMGKRTRLT